MIRKIIHIDTDACTGCGLCAEACHEGAIQMIDGKAILTREDYCDGLGDCLPACPAGAISFVEREAPAYDHAAVQKAKEALEYAGSEDSHCACPSAASRSLSGSAAQSQAGPEDVPGCLSQWPVQIKLAPIHAPYFANADLLIAADCTAFSYGNFHHDFIRDHITLIGCPKLDSTDYSEKLTEILRENDIRSITVTRMEVPCCGGIQFAVEQAVENSGKKIPCKVFTIGIDGNLL